MTHQRSNNGSSNHNQQTDTAPIKEVHIEHFRLIRAQDGVPRRPLLQSYDTTVILCLKCLYKGATLPHKVHNHIISKLYSSYFSFSQANTDLSVVAYVYFAGTTVHCRNHHRNVVFTAHDRLTCIVIKSSLIFKSSLFIYL